MKFKSRWIGVEIFILNEVAQAPKGKHYMFSQTLTDDCLKIRVLTEVRKLVKDPWDQF